LIILATKTIKKICLFAIRLLWKKWKKSEDL
jgi:hypothetical protein